MGETLGRIQQWVKAHPVLTIAIVLVVGVVAYLIYRARSSGSQAQGPQLAPAEGTIGQPSTGGDVTVPPPSDSGGVGAGGGGIIQIQPYPISTGGSSEGGNAGPGSISGSPPTDGGAPGTLPGSPGVPSGIALMPYALTGQTPSASQPNPSGAGELVVIPGTGFGFAPPEPPAAGSIVGIPLGSNSYGSNMPLVGSGSSIQPIAPNQPTSSGSRQIQPFPAPTEPLSPGRQIQPYPAPGGGAGGGGRPLPRPLPREKPTPKQGRR